MAKAVSTKTSKNAIGKAIKSKATKTTTKVATTPAKSSKTVLVAKKSSTATKSAAQKSGKQIATKALAGAKGKSSATTSPTQKKAISKKATSVTASLLPKKAANSSKPKTKSPEPKLVAVKKAATKKSAATPVVKAKAVAKKSASASKKASVKATKAPKHVKGSSAVATKAKGKKSEKASTAVAPKATKNIVAKAATKLPKPKTEKVVKAKKTGAKKGRKEAALAKLKPIAVVKEIAVQVAEAKQHLNLSKPVNKILITQPKPETDKSPYFDLAKKYNVDLEFFPFIRVEGVSGRDFRRQKINMSEHTAIVFTSRSAVDHFFRIMEEMKVRVSQEMKYCCITEAVALYLQKFILYRKRKVFFSADGSQQGLLDVITKHKHENYIIPSTETGKNELGIFMSKQGIKYSEATLFRTISNDIGSVMKKFMYDMVVFFSPFSVQALQEHTPGFKQNGTMFGAFGPITSKAIEDLGFRLDVKAPAPNAPSMVAALEQLLEAFKK
ncbi:MAG: uroporphyrinogen-III synthase [Bacteroidetes bacterium]|nr:uroporphyrinogen-III synthase [Bacteroidota bacterium]